MTQKIVKRNKLFYALPSLFPDWDYPTRNAIGMNLNDFYWKKDEKYSFEIKGVVYEIDSKKAEVLGRKYVCHGGTMPHIIPLDEFTIVGGKQQTKLL